MAADQIAHNVAEIESRITTACQRAGRSRDEVTLVAVSKTVEPERIRAALAAGVKVLGENRVQEALTKMPELAEYDVQWHLIGHLQSNKARKAVECFAAIHTVDSFKLAERLAASSDELNQRLPIFIEVNLGDEASKAGVTEADVLPLCEQVARLPHLALKGLMAVPPFLDNPEEVRPYFRRLRQLRDEALKTGIVPASFTQLSMGMSNDFEVAIEEGATFVRVGTALFGTRQYI
ncbi:MAG: YggS family pyridoxal phosphate-dependent enzyme [Acidobacteria bacterium]|nr:YggS family pyridoxal phosphate-dependent enzyme [Acidobacteriota bacterium]